MPLEKLNFQIFESELNSTFNVVLSQSAVVPLTLIQASRADQPDSRYENFSLFFDGPADHPLPQRIYAFEHERLGQFDLFIVPIGNERGRFQYQAVFNRLRSGS
jgi:hypothetical protein